MRNDEGWKVNAELGDTGGPKGTREPLWGRAEATWEPESAAETSQGLDTVLKNLNLTVGIMFAQRSDRSSRWGALGSWDRQPGRTGLPLNSLLPSHIPTFLSSHGTRFVSRASLKFPPLHHQNYSQLSQYIWDMYLEKRFFSNVGFITILPSQRL